MHHRHHLATIIPNRHLILDRDRERRHHARIRHRRHEARLEPRHVRHHFVDRLARVAEGGLHDGMVFGVEVELNHATNGRSEAVGLEDEVGVFVGYFDDIDGCGGGRHGCAACAGGHHWGGCGDRIGGHGRRHWHGGLGYGAAGESEGGKQGDDVHLGLGVIRLKCGRRSKVVYIIGWMKVVEKKGRERRENKNENRWAKNERERDNMVYDMHLGYDAWKVLAGWLSCHNRFWVVRGRRMDPGARHRCTCHASGFIVYRPVTNGLDEDLARRIPRTIYSLAWWLRAMMAVLEAGSCYPSSNEATNTVTHERRIVIWILDNNSINVHWRR